MRYSEELNGAFYIGRVGENNTTTLIVNVKGWKSSFGEGLFSIVHKRNGDTAPYPCGNVTYNATNETLEWLIQSADVAKIGKGELQVSYIVNNAVAKSVIYATLVQASLGDTTTPPEPWESWVDEVLEARDDAEDAADRAEEAESQIKDMTATASTLPAGSTATVTKTEETDHFNLAFGIPRGDTGASGVAVSETQPTDPSVNVWVNPAGTADAGYVPVGGTTGQALVKHSNTNYDTEWKTISEQDPRIPSTLTAGKFLKVNTAETGFELANTHKYPYLYVLHWYRDNGGYPLNLYMTMLSEGDMGTYNYQLRDYLMTHTNPIIALNGSCYIYKDGAYKLVRIEYISFYTQYSNLYANVWHDDGDSFTTVVLGGQGGGDLTASTKILL